MNGDKIEIVATLVNDTAAGAAEVGASLEGVESKAASAGAGIGKSMASVGSSLSSVGKSLTTYVTLPIVAVAAASTAMAMKFQQDMTLIQTQAGASAAQVASLSTQVLALAQNSKFGPDELAQGLYHIISLGVPANQAMQDLVATQKLAAVGNSDLETTTNAVAVAWKSGIQGAQNFGVAANSLNAIVGAGNMKMDDLVSALGPTGLLAAAKTAGLSLNDVGSAEALLSDMTGNAQQSATHLRMALSLMGSGSAAANTDLATIGLSTQKLAVDMQEGGLPKALGDLKTKLNAAFGPTSLTTMETYTSVLKSKGTDAAQTFANKSAEAANVVSKAFGGAKTGATMEQLLQGYSTGSLGQKETQVGNTSASANNNYAATQQTAAYKLSAAWASIQSTLITIGGQIMPLVALGAEKLSKGIYDVVQWFDKLSPAQKKVVEFGLLFAALLGPVLSAAGAILGLVAAVIAIGAPAAIAIGVVVALTAAASALMIWWKPVSKFFVDMWDDIAKTFKQVNWGKVGGDMVTAFLAPWLAIPMAIGKMLSSIGPIKTALHDLHIPGFANGVTNFSGGLAMVGENGPELVDLPGGSNVYPNGKGPSGGGKTNVTIQNVNLHTAAAVKEFFQSFDQDSINVGKGLTAARGMS